MELVTEICSKLRALCGVRSAIVHQPLRDFLAEDGFRMTPKNVMVIEVAGGVKNQILHELRIIFRSQSARGYGFELFHYPLTACDVDHIEDDLVDPPRIPIPAENISVRNWLAHFDAMEARNADLMAKNLALLEGLHTMTERAERAEQALRNIMQTVFDANGVKHD